MIDKLSVFHGVNGQHAGTLEIRETRKSGALPLYDWAWHGGWAGSQNGQANWDDKANWGDEVVGLDLVQTMPVRPLLLINKAWIGINRPPPRPWFKMHDTIELLDWNFGRDRPRPHAFKCKFIGTTALQVERGAPGRDSDAYHGLRRLPWRGTVAKTEEAPCRPMSEAKSASTTTRWAQAFRCW